MKSELCKVIEKELVSILNDIYKKWCESRHIRNFNVRIPVVPGEMGPLLGEAISKFVLGGRRFPISIEKPKGRMFVPYLYAKGNGIVNLITFEFEKEDYSCQCIEITPVPRDYKGGDINK